MYVCTCTYIHVCCVMLRDGGLKIFCGTPTLASCDTLKHVKLKCMHCTSTECFLLHTECAGGYFRTNGGCEMCPKGSNRMAGDDEDRCSCDDGFVTSEGSDFTSSTSVVCEGKVLHCTIQLTLCLTNWLVIKGHQ